MTPTKDWFDTYRLVNSSFVLIGNDASCRVVGMGNIIVKMFEEESDFIGNSIR